MIYYYRVVALHHVVLIIDYLKYDLLYITVITITNKIALQILLINLKKNSHLNMII